MVITWREVSRSGSKSLAPKRRRAATASAHDPRRAGVSEGRHPSDTSGPVGLGFKSSRSRAVFEHLVDAFIEDYMKKRRPSDDSGWRGLSQLARTMNVSPSSMYGKRGGMSPELGELVKLGLVETRLFRGERGRGGEVTRMRVAYERDPIREYVKERVTSISEGDAPLGAFLSKNRLVVLPFVNMSPDPNDEFFADGLTEELIDRISQIRELDVIARTSAMTYKKREKKAAEIGKELRAGTLVEGSVRRAGNKIRVTAQLIDANTEGSLWSSSYDSELRDILEVQGDIAGQVAESLRIQLLPSEEKAIQKKGTGNPEAFILFLKGRYYWNERTNEGVVKAIEYIERAVERDPGYALAYVGLSDSYTIMANYEFATPTDTLERAKDYATKALELDRSLAEAHASLGNALLESGDLKGGGGELRKAIELNPSYASAHQWYGEYLFDVEGDSEQMIAEKLRAQRLDPLSATTNMNVGVGYYVTRQYEVAASALRRTIQMFPEFYNAHVWLAAVLMMTGEFEESLAEVDRAASLSADEAYVTMARGAIYGMWGKKEPALNQIARLETISRTRYVTPAQIGFVYTAIGNRDEAFRWFEKAHREHSAGIRQYLFHPFVRDRLETDPRWRDLRHRLGLAP